MLLPELPAGMTLTLRVSPAVTCKTVFGEVNRYAQDALEVTACFDAPEITMLDVSINRYDKTVRADAYLTRDALWQYLLLDEAGNILEEQITTDPSFTIQFGEGSDYEIPEDGACYRLRSRACREDPGLVIFGTASEDVVITGESLKEPELNPVLTEDLKNTITITWDETRGAYYKVQLLDPQTNEWYAVRRISSGEPLTYTTWLEPGYTYQYRVAAVDEQGEYLDISEPLTFTGKELTKYATVWPIKNLAAYSAPDAHQIIGTAREETAYCVLEEVNGLFAVRINDQIGYIDSNYCMINLPEYLGGLCNYNITNSIYSIYTVHEFAIPGVTGKVTVGYEDVCQEDGSYLVPLLYPTAKKLLNAAKTAWEQGYRLKIYDSFRPGKATKELYQLTSMVLNDPLPDTTYEGAPKTDLALPQPRIGTDELTYGWLMTGANYSLNSFLAQSGSMHNLGIALDLTLESRKTGEQLLMQTAVHDLSQYSVLSRNNGAANLLAQIMHSAGFGGLVSEWWHFQDDQAYNNLSLYYIANGVNAACWMKDDTGWRYRNAKGGYYAGETVTISGTAYTFDSNGYVAD